MIKHDHSNAVGINSKENGPLSLGNGKNSKQNKKIRFLEVRPSRTRHSDEDDGSGKKITTYKNAAKSIMYAVQTTAISKLEL